MSMTDVALDQSLRKIKVKVILREQKEGLVKRREQLTLLM